MQPLAKSPTALNLTIRPALERDIELIMALACRIWPVCFANILTPEQIANMLARIYSRENLIREVKSGHRFWVACESTTPLGFVSAYKEKGEIWLKKLYLIASAQGKGIGSRMIDTATRTFLPARELRLLVHRENIFAQKVYEHIGFKRIGEVPVTMGDFNFVDYLYSKPISTEVVT